MAQHFRRPPTEGSDRLPDPWTLGCLPGARCLWPDLIFPFSVGLWSRWVPITVAAIIVIFSDAPKASLRAYRLI